MADDVDTDTSAATGYTDSETFANTANTVACEERPT